MKLLALEVSLLGVKARMTPGMTAEGQHGGGTVGDSGNQVSGGGVAGPQDDGRSTQNRELAGSQSGQQLVGSFEVGEDAHPTPVVAISGGHSPTPAARALAPL